MGMRNPRAVFSWFAEGSKMKKFLTLTVLALVLLAAACQAQGTHQADRAEVLKLICGATPETQCLDSVCTDLGACPLLTALSDGAVFNFMKTYAQCEDCNTPVFAPQLGIGKCIEYQVSESAAGWTVIFWVSENCGFRYGSPSESRVSVEVDAAVRQIKRISPPVEYLNDPLYCQTAANCRDLAGSGVPFVGCSNALYAPLHWSGFGPGERCTCEDQRCVTP
jgi:hypothetical protein